MAIKGGSDQFQILIESHRGILYKVSKCYCSNPDDRDDLIQEVIVQLWRSFPTFDESKSFSTWMYRIALNVAISNLRTEKVRSKHIVSADDRILEAVDVTANVSETALMLYQLIEQMEPLNRALMLLFLDGFSHREISEVLGISETNVATKIGRLKKVIQQALSTDGQGIRG